MKSELVVLGNEFVHNRHSHASHSANSISKVHLQSFQVEMFLYQTIIPVILNNPITDQRSTGAFCTAKLRVR